MRHIATVAWELFETMGFEQISMETIATQADVAKATLYKYFDSKEALLEFQLRHSMGEQREHIQTELLQRPTLRSRLDFLFQVEAEFLESKKNYMKPLLHHRLRQFQNHQSSRDKSQFFQALVIIFQMAQQTGELRRDLSAESMANYLNFLRSADLFDWLSGPQEDLRQLHHRMLDLFMEGACFQKPEANS
ncbi:helix-turn-helix domain-containing protein [Undibacterium cyanobacteriorum]|uniref:Helix-turn-helix domain-containing protein n=1 Tax=Undibacterium cyanobacteriorum TaxID=3073561 RepID=A0ABY9RDA5_9BURK|nr:helix-turn-helix domain-containing protein [Undibacterium sp. 20NA77.5]WMW79221.1 helix-turn-helix domain-containing protein [Undibacterium sp. 20NA77.5]